VYQLIFPTRKCLTEESNGKPMNVNSGRKILGLESFGYIGLSCALFFVMTFRENAKHREG
jgi:hypothetical protein